jgi:hypothetical protein
VAGKPEFVLVYLAASIIATTEELMFLAFRTIYWWFIV